MKIDDLTIKEAKEIAHMVANLFGGKASHIRQHPFEVGKAYFIRTITHHYIGVVREICELCIVMDNCSWVADDGRYHKLMRGVWDDKSEVEPYPKECLVPVFFGAMIDSREWNFDIPTEVK
jgi:hypothetical protein